MTTQLALTHAFLNGCVNKVSYLKRSRAEAALCVVAAKTRRFDGVTAYRCKFCGMWHLGHDRKKSAGL